MPHKRLHDQLGYENFIYHTAAIPTALRGRYGLARLGVLLGRTLVPPKNLLDGSDIAAETQGRLGQSHQGPHGGGGDSALDSLRRR
jgi:hypothetical protein